MARQRLSPTTSIAHTAQPVNKKGGHTMKQRVWDKLLCGMTPMEKRVYRIEHALVHLWAKVTRREPPKSAEDVRKEREARRIAAGEPTIAEADWYRRRYVNGFLRQYLGCWSCLTHCRDWLQEPTDDPPSLDVCNGCEKRMRFYMQPELAQTLEEVYKLQAQDPAYQEKIAKGKCAYGVHYILTLPEKKASYLLLDLHPESPAPPQTHTPSYWTGCELSGLAPARCMAFSDHRTDSFQPTGLSSGCSGGGCQ